MMHCTVTVAPTIEHHGGHSQTPANQRRDQVHGSQKTIKSQNIGLKIYSIYLHEHLWYK